MSIIENACGDTMSLGGGFFECTLSKGHAGAHIDAKNHYAWGSSEPTQQEILDQATRTQIDALDARTAQEIEFAKARDAERIAYDQSEGKRARAHGWALCDAQVWASFAAAALRDQPGDDDGDGARRAAITADRLFEDEYLRRFDSPGDRE